MPLELVVAIGVAVLLGAAAGAASGWACTRWTVSNSFATEREQVRAVLARARIDLEEAGSELEKWSQRGARERARVEQSERRAKGTPNGAAAAPSFPDVRSYHRHLTRGGARSPEFESTLGWGFRSGDGG